MHQFQIQQISVILAWKLSLLPYHLMATCYFDEAEQVCAIVIQSCHDLVSIYKYAALYELRLNNPPLSEIFVYHRYTL